MSLLVGTFLVVGCIALSLVGLVAVRRAVPLPLLETHHEVAGFFIGVLAVIYAVLLAFVVVVVWERFDEAHTIVAREANDLEDVVRLAEAFDPAIRDRVREEALEYARLVIDDEWKAMERGESSPRTRDAFHQLRRTLLGLEPATPREIAIYSAVLDRFTDLSDDRRLRIHASHDSIPGILWTLLWGGALITVGFTYFFGVKRMVSQALMTAALAAEIAFVLFLIAGLNLPFEGAARVTPEAFEELRATLEHQLPG